MIIIARKCKCIELYIDYITVTKIGRISSSFDGNLYLSRMTQRTSHPSLHLFSTVYSQFHSLEVAGRNRNVGMTPPTTTSIIHEGRKFCLHNIQNTECI